MPERASFNYDPASGFTPAPEQVENPAAAMARDGLERSRAGYQTRLAQQIQAQQNRQPDYVLEGYDGGQPLLRPVGGSGTIRGQQDTTGALEIGAIVDVQTAGGIVRAGGMPYVKPVKTSRSTKKVDFGYLFEFQHWDRCKLLYKFPNGTVQTLADQQGKWYGCSYLTMPDKATALADLWELDLTSYTSSALVFSHTWNYSYKKLAATAATELHSASRLWDTLGIAYSYVQPESVSFPFTDKAEFFSPNYFTEGALSIAAEVITPVFARYGGQLIRPSVYNNFTGFTPAAGAAGFIKPVNATTAYAFMYEDLGDSPSGGTRLGTPTVSGGYIVLPTGKFYKLTSSGTPGGAVSAQYLRDFTPKIRIADLGIPDYLVPFITGVYAESGGTLVKQYDNTMLGISQAYDNTVYPPDTPSAVVQPGGNFSFPVLDGIVITLWLTNTSYATDPAWGSPLADIGGPIRAFTSIVIRPFFGAL